MDVQGDRTLEFGDLIEPDTSLLTLDEPFGEEEIWNAVKRMPMHKAPGPDGFTTKFLRAYWGCIKSNVFDVFQELYELRGRGFGRLNRALLTLIPKHADASTLRDYKPISPIHLIAKLFAKVLSLCMDPKLDSSSAPSRAPSSLDAASTTTLSSCASPLGCFTALASPVFSSSSTSQILSTPCLGPSFLKNYYATALATASSSGW
uniref:Uncharacterized protein n=1 Tax=Avena sativa TaxID=4498 RepID=A0ACD5W0M6_AVESA